MSTMARLLVYDAYENKVYTYANLREKIAQAIEA